MELSENELIKLFELHLKYCVTDNQIPKNDPDLLKRYKEFKYNARLKWGELNPKKEAKII